MLNGLSTVPRFDTLSHHKPEGRLLSQRIVGSRRFLLTVLTMNPRFCSRCWRPHTLGSHRPNVLRLRDLGRNTRLSSQSPDCLGHELTGHGAGIGEQGDDVPDQPGRRLAQLFELELPELVRHLSSGVEDLEDVVDEFRAPQANASSSKHHTVGASPPVSLPARAVSALAEASESLRTSSS